MKTEGLPEELRSRLDIVDVISDYLELRRSGQNYKGLCPFHSEKTPSFIVSPDKQIFHCFGCNTGGDIVSFVMKYENLSFNEVLRLLAKKAGISLKVSRPVSDDEKLKERLLEVHRETSKAFTENLRKSSQATGYLRNRGLKDDIIHAFSVGYALKDWHSLYERLKGRQFHDSAISRSGVVASGDKGLYDIFRNRIMFPIHDIQGDIIAFGGRVLDDSQPKYLNSPDTPIFRKGETLFGLSLSKEGIRKKGYAMVVEGYFDVLLCHQHGFDNVVAPLGTALTTEHIKKIKRFTKKAVLVFDGDAAGRSAATRAIPLLMEHELALKILLLPENEDPDSFLGEKGADAFNGLLSKSMSAVDFIMGIHKNDKAENIHALIEIIACAKDAIMKEELIRELSEKTGVREPTIRAELKKTARGLNEKRKGPQPVETPFTSLYDEELILLSAGIAFSDRLDYILQRLEVDELKNILVKNLFEKLNMQGNNPDVTMLSSLGDEEKRLVTGLTIKPGFDPEAVDRNIEDCIRKINARKFDRRLKQAKQAGDLNLLNSLLVEKQKLLKGDGRRQMGDRI